MSTKKPKFDEMTKIKSPQNRRIDASQCLTSFPDENNKHIDYVIVYKKFNDTELKNKKKLRTHRMRELFFDKLEKETLEIYEIKFTDEKGDPYVYALLHCPIERLLEEAAQLNYEIKLKNVGKLLIFSLLFFSFGSNSSKWFYISDFRDGSSSEPFEPF